MPEGTKQGDVMKKCSEIWNTLSDSQRKIYDQKHEEDIERYND